MKRLFFIWVIILIAGTGAKYVISSRAVTPPSQFMTASRQMFVNHQLLSTDIVAHLGNTSTNLLRPSWTGKFLACIKKAGDTITAGELSSVPVLPSGYKDSLLYLLNLRTHETILTRLWEPGDSLMICTTHCLEHPVCILAVNKDSSVSEHMWILIKLLKTAAAEFSTIAEDTNRHIFLRGN